MRKTSVLERLAAEYPQLYLNPDTDTQETYRLIPALMKDADMGETKTQTRRNTP